MSILEVSDVTKSFGSALVLKGISLAVEAGEFLAIMGPSGSGKSTLLHIMGAMDRPTAGSVRLEGNSLFAMPDRQLSHIRRRRFGFVFQTFELIPVFSALDNVLLPLMLDGPVSPAARRKGMELLEQVGMAEFANHKPSQLSGGQQQRVAVARALVADPAVLFADEPTGSLDSAAGKQVLALLSGLTRERQTALVMVTHDRSVAETADRIIVIHDGAIEEEVRGQNHAAVGSL